MYLHIKSFDANTLTIDSGPGPRLIGHYTSSAMWRVASSVIANVASRLPGTFVAISASKAVAPQDLMLGDGSWAQLTEDQLRNTQRGGWCWTEEGETVLFLPSDRDEIEDAVYRTMDSGICFIADAELRSNTSTRELLRALNASARVIVDASYFDLDIVINDPELVQFVLVRVAQVIEWFNQV